MDNYSDIRFKVANLIPFRGNTMTGLWITAKDGTEIYRVFSYSTLIAQTFGGSSWVDDRKFSVTTSKHQNIIRKAWSLS